MKKQNRILKALLRFSSYDPGESEYIKGSIVKPKNPSDAPERIITTSFVQELNHKDIENYNLISLLRFINREIAVFHFHQNLKSDKEREILCNFFFASENLYNFCPSEYLDSHKSMGKFATEEQISSFSTGEGRALLESLSKDILFCSRIEKSLLGLHQIYDTPHYYYLVNMFEPSFKRVLKYLDEYRALFGSVDEELVHKAQLIVSRVADEILVQKKEKTNGKQEQAELSSNEQFYIN